MGSDISIEQLRRFAEDYVKAETSRMASGGWWQSPLMVSASIDRRFDDLPKIAADDHLLPRVVVIALPACRAKG